MPCECCRGPCCLNGSCSLETLAGCQDLGGVFKGYGNACEDAGCDEGGCCQQNGTCGVVKKSVCDNIPGATFFGFLTDCSSAACPERACSETYQYGACPDGQRCCSGVCKECCEADGAEIASLRYEYQFLNQTFVRYARCCNGTIVYPISPQDSPYFDGEACCSDGNCPPYQACVDGKCRVERPCCTASSCSSIPWVSCTGDIISDCYDCRGACCFDDGSCVNRVYESSCRREIFPGVYEYGTFQGRNTSCSQVSCPVTCPGDIEILYTWSASQSDLDTATVFLNGKVGFDCGSSSAYMSWPSGDVRGSGGTERVVIDADGALAAGQWSGSVQVALHAGWYEGGSSGTITITARCVGSSSGQSVTVTPGGTHPCSTSSPSHRVATLTITQNNGFSLSSDNPLP